MNKLLYFSFGNHIEWEIRHGETVLFQTCDRDLAIDLYLAQATCQ